MDKDGAGSAQWCPAVGQEEGAEADGQEFPLNTERLGSLPRWGYSRPAEQGTLG